MSKLIAAIRLMRLYYSGPMAGTFSLTAWYATGDAPRLAELLLATLAVGALIAGMAILGNFEKIALVVFIPYISDEQDVSRAALRLVKGGYYALASH